MPDLDREFLRKLAGWSTNGTPVSSLYLDVDGRRHPHKQDCLHRAERLCHQLRRQAEDLDREARSSVVTDSTKMLEFLQGMERGATKGVALFSSSGSGRWEEVLVPRPVRDLASVDGRPHVLPLEALVETYESFCTVIVDRSRARIFLARMGRLREQADVEDEVPGPHAQGGRAQLNRQQHIEDLVSRHLKHVAEVLLRFFQARGFDHLILAGPDELLPGLERHLHDYLRRRIAARVSQSMTASAEEVLQRSLAVEEEVEAERERLVMDRLVADSAAGRHAVTGLPAALRALGEGRVGTLVVPFGFGHEGRECAACGRLAVDGEHCETCGGDLIPVPDVVERAVVAALRQSSRVETLTQGSMGEAGGPAVGALLRY